eukprot:scaffold177_cov334-Pavlova_lutheri.AAC.24
MATQMESVRRTVDAGTLPGERDGAARTWFAACERGEKGRSDGFPLEGGWQLRRSQPAVVGEGRHGVTNARDS